MLFDLAPKMGKGDFYDFEEELGELISSLKDPHTRMIVVKGLRRTGKSSLLRVALRESRVPHIYVDLRKAVSPSEFMSIFQGALSDLLASLRWPDKLLKRLEVSIEIKGLKVSFKRKKLDLFVDTIEKLNKWALDKNSRLMLALDEAQELRFIKGFDKLLAYVYDNLRGIGVVIAGSEVGVLDRFLGIERPKSPLFGRGILEVKTVRFDRDKAINFLTRGFDEVGIRVKAKTLEEVVNKAGGIVGWLTLYGWLVWKGKSPEMALGEMIKKGSSLLADEIERFLKPRELTRSKYLALLEGLSIKAMGWSEAKSYTMLRAGELDDRSFTNIIHSLQGYGFIEKIGEKYRLVDPLIAEAIKKVRR